MGAQPPTLIVSFGADGGTDTPMRTLAEGYLEIQTKSHALLMQKLESQNRRRHERRLFVHIPSRILDRNVTAKETP